MSTAQVAHTVLDYVWLALPPARSFDQVFDATASGMSMVQVVLAFLEPVWLYSVASLTGGGFLGWSAARKVSKSRTAESLGRVIAGSVEVKGMSRSLRQEGMPDADRHQLAIEIWRRNLDLGDPPDT